MPITATKIIPSKAKKAVSLIGTKNTDCCVFCHCVKDGKTRMITNTFLHNKEINAAVFPKSSLFFQKVDILNCDIGGSGNNNLVERDNSPFSIRIFNKVLSKKFLIHRSFHFSLLVHVCAAFLIISLSISISNPFTLTSAAEIPTGSQAVFGDLNDNSESNPGTIQQTKRNQAVDLTKLFSDVSRTVSGIGTILRGTHSTISSPQLPLSDPAVGGDSSDKMNSNDGVSEGRDVGESESSLPFAGLLGGSNVCFKTCGMEDIQFAARRAGEMFLTMKVCMVILTIVTALCALMLTAVALFFSLSRKGNLNPEPGVKKKTSILTQDDNNENTVLSSTRDSAHLRSSNFDNTKTYDVVNCAPPSFFAISNRLSQPSTSPHFSSTSNNIRSSGIEIARQFDGRDTNVSHLCYSEFGGEHDPDSRSRS